MKKLLLSALALCLVLGLTVLTVSAAGAVQQKPEAVQYEGETAAFTCGEWEDETTVRCERFATRYDMRQTRTVTMRQQCTHCDETTSTTLTESRITCPHTTPME